MLINVNPCQVNITLPVVLAHDVKDFKTCMCKSDSNM